MSPDPHPLTYPKSRKRILLVFLNDAWLGEFHPAANQFLSNYGNKIVGWGFVS